MLPRPPVILQLGMLRAKAMLWRGVDQRLRITVAVGATFEMANGALSKLARIQQAPADADLVPHKARVDVLVRAAAHAVTPVEQLDVSVTIGAMNKSLTITGDRCWIAGAHGIVVGPPTPFEYMPIDNTRGPRSALNPNGVGFERHEGQVLPNIAVLGPAGAAMLPGYGRLSQDVRAAHVVLTQAQRRWLERGIPEGKAAPAGFEGEYFNLAPPEQRIDQFEGQQRLSFKNLHPAHRQFDTIIDVPTPGAIWQSCGQHWPLSLRCDTVAIDLLHGTAQLTLRGFAIVTDRAQLGVGTLMVSDSRDTPREEVAAEQQARMETTIIVPYRPDANQQPLPFVERARDAEQPEAEADASSPLPPSAEEQGGIRETADMPARRARTETAALNADALLVARGEPPFATAPDSEATFRWFRQDDEEDARVEENRPRDTAELDLQFDGSTSVSGDLPFTSPAVLQPTPAAASATAPQPPSPAPPPVAAPLAIRQSEPRPVVVVRPPDPLNVARPATAAQPLEPPPLASTAASSVAEAPPPAVPVNAQADAPQSDEVGAELTLERVAAIEAAIDSEAASDTGLEARVAVLERFDADDEALTAASARIHEEQMAALHRGERERLDRYDRAYVAQLEEQRGTITINDYATLEVAVERDSVASALAELQLPAASVLRIKRLWMKKLVSDMTLSKQLRKALAAARGRH